MNVFNVEQSPLMGSLIAENDVRSVAYHAGSDVDEEASSVHDSSHGHNDSTPVLAAVTDDGVVELFARPFEGFGQTQPSSNSLSLKSRRKQMTRKAEASVKILRPGKSSTVVRIIDASFHGPDLVVASADGGLDVMFERVRWEDDATGQLMLKGPIELVRGKSASGLGATVMNGVKDLGKSKVDESQAVVVKDDDLEDLQMANHEHEVVILSSDNEDSSDEDVPSEGDGAPDNILGEVADDGDEEMKDAAQDDVPVENAGEATFGDLLRATAPAAVDVSAAFEDAQSKAVVQIAPNTSLQLPTGMSLGTVLTQSLKTNDTVLLEKCLHEQDRSVIRDTIERIDSPLAAALLQKLAERLHSRPGRAGNMMVWVQWTLICHGGYLAGQPDLMKKLSSLHRVVKERASSLQPLLSLKGKLDMLEAQMNLRRSMQNNARAALANEEDDEEAVIYVEGQDESDSDAESAVVDSNPKPSGPTVGVDGDGSQDGRMSGEDDGMDMPTTVNGVVPDSEEEDDSGSESGLFDDEASETDNDSGDDLSDEEIDYEDVDSNDDDNESDIRSPPAKRTTKPQLENGVPSRQ